MQKDLKCLLEAINLANYDELKTVEISMKDLMLLRKHILKSEEKINYLNNRLIDKEATNNRLQIKLTKLPIKLDTYI